MDQEKNQVQVDERILGRAVSAEVLAEYQEGAIVSRQLTSQKTGNVTVFAFDRGQALSEHTAPFHALVHVLDGTAQISIQGQRHTVPKGEVILMPANIPHAVKAEERFKMMLVMIRS